MNEQNSDRNIVRANNSNNVVWHNATVTRRRREKLNGHKGVLLWITGLSGSGKSTLAHTVEEKLHQLHCRTIVLDGDNIRHGLCQDLGFSDEDRMENIRRIGEVTKLFIETGTIIFTAFISPFKKDRQALRELLEDDYIEIYCKCPIEVCEQRDVKGLYKKAKAGLIKNFTGVSSVYEEPDANLTIDTDSMSLKSSVDLIIELLVNRKIIDKAII